jgi:hypothetical protein
VKGSRATQRSCLGLEVNVENRSPFRPRLKAELLLGRDKSGHKRPTTATGSSRPFVNRQLRSENLTHESAVQNNLNQWRPTADRDGRKTRIAQMRGYRQWRWHLDEVFVKINGRLCYL